MFDVGAPEFLLLIVIAIILFGPEKLPEFARKAARVIKYIRTMAGNAQQQLGKELGPEFENVDLRDLNPKAFVQKHLLDDVEPIVADVKADLKDAGTLSSGAAKELTAAVDDARSGSVNGSATPSPVQARILTPFDPDAT